MRDAVYHQYARAFDTHWWADHRRKLITRWLTQLGVTADGSRAVLEIGSGAGTEHAYLHQYGKVTGIDINETALSYCRERGYSRLLAADLNTVDFSIDQFDLAVDFHVLYHEWVREPVEVLKRIRLALRPGGRLILTEPAYELFRREHDVAVMAARRWNRREILDLVRAAGFEVERCSGFLTLLLPAVLASLLLDRIRPSIHDVGELEAPHPFVDRALRVVMAIERLLIRIHPLPVGTCWAIIARRT